MNIYLVVLLIIAIVILSNALMFAMVRGSRDMKIDWLNNTKKDLSKSFQNENSELTELRQRVKELENQSDQQPE